MAPAMASQILDKLSNVILGRTLGLERHEYVAVAWSFAYFFCVLSSYYMLRPLREAMGVSSGPLTLPWLFFSTFLAMLVATPIFGWVASRFTRRQFLPWVYLFFISNIVLFWAVFSIAVDDGSPHIWLGRVFFVWLSVFNLFVVSVFWSFMADIYTREQGRRLFGVISAGGSIGALIGSAATGALVVRIGFQNLFPISATFLLVAVFCITQLRHWVEHEHRDEITETAAGDKPLGGNPFSGITHVFSSKYFFAIAISSIIASLLGTALYMFSAQLVEQAIAGPDERTRYFSIVDIGASALALVIQLLIVRRVVSRFGIGVSLAIMPIVSVLGFALLAINPVLGVVALLTAVRRALGFGFSKPTSDMLYSVVTAEEKYKSKNFIDTSVYRGGDVIGIWTVRGIMGAGLGVAAISWMMLPFAALWAIVSLWLGRDYRRQASQLRRSGVI